LNERTNRVLSGLVAVILFAATVVLGAKLAAGATKPVYHLSGTFSSAGQGLLSGKYQVSAPRNFRRFSSDFSADGRARREPLVAALRDIAGRHRATAAQIALAWVVNKPNVVAIPGASSVAQVEENAAAAELSLGDDEVQRLDSLSA